jgi:hypothetical protein
MRLDLSSDFERANLKNFAYFLSEKSSKKVYLFRLHKKKA